MSSPSLPGAALEAPLRWSPDRPHPWSVRWVVIGLLLGGVLLRWAALAPMTATMLHYDEAYNAVDALHLLADFRLTPFLPGNFGRESGWVYWLMPFLATLGRGLVAIRFAATVTGILTLAAVYRLGYELFDRRARVGGPVAPWSLAVLAVLYWHVHLSHLALRANLFVLVGTLAAALLVRAYHRNRFGAWAAGGLALGALIYTYFASAAWGFYLGLLLVGVLALDGRRRKGVLIALVCGALVAAPMVRYALLHPDQVLGRSSTVSQAGLDAILTNAHTWGRALFQRGDPNVTFNLPGRPIFGPFTGALALLALPALLLRRRWWAAGLLTGGLAIAGLMPSLASNFAPHFLRGAGLTVPLALLLGLGATLLGWGLQRLSGWRGAWLAPLLLIVPAGFVSYRDFHARWLEHPETFVSMEMHVNQAANLIKAAMPEDVYTYFSPFTPGHPVLIVRAQDLAPRPFGAFNSHECWVVPVSRAAYVSLTRYEPSFEATLSQWGTVTPFYVDDGLEAGAAPRYSVFDFVPDDWAGLQPAARFGDRFEVRLLNALPETSAPGAVVPVWIGVRALRTPEIAPSLFLHLYGIPSPYEGGVMWGQADSQLCTSYPAHLWRTTEMVVQRFELTVPADVTEDRVVIGMGLYPFPDGVRLPVTAPEGSVHDYVALHELRIEGVGGP